MTNSLTKRKNCSALPTGVNWTPVDDVLKQLRKRIAVVVQPEKISFHDCNGRVLAENISARSSNPPYTNSAVDGFGFHAPVTEALVKLTLVDGRSAAGKPFTQEVQRGYCIRIFTGAVIPDGVNTVVLNEEVKLSGNQITLSKPYKIGSNIRKAGEDCRKGQIIFEAGHIVKPQDLALLSAAGISEVSVRRRLKVGVFSTGNEVTEAKSSKKKKLSFGEIYDSNRPMLLALLNKWNFEAVDLGIVPDDVELVRSILNAATKDFDALITSGGASNGAEDYISKLLKQEGSLHNWRIAVKPGRPLALGEWNGVPIFGLPGNPVAAFVCTLIFARPALGVLAGAKWHVPHGFRAPSYFKKDKKSGRREYLRARLNRHGRVEAFASEGSGLISSLVWSNGLVELPDEELELKIGEPIRFIPYSSFDFS